MSNMTIQGRVKGCAEAVLFNMNSGAANSRYNMAFFGSAMRKHLAVIKEEGLPSPRPDIMAKVAKAEAALKANCDGKDCSFAGGES